MTVAACPAIFSLTDQFDLPTVSGLIGEAAPARLIGDRGERRCFVHRIATRGALLSITGPIAHGEHGRIELPFGFSADGSTVGNDPAAAGFRFDAPVDVVGALARCLAALPAERRQMPRIELRQRLCVRHGGQVDFAWTRNLSPTGVGIETRIALTPGEAVELTLDGLRPVRGEIRWADDGQAGIAFADPLGWQLLMPWLRKVANDASSVAAPRVDSPPSALGAVKDAVSVDLATQVRSGAGWWNARLTMLSSTLVEFESATEFAPRASLWLALPEIGGWPARVIESRGPRHIAEFRVPLRQHEMTRLGEVTRGR